MEEKIERSVSLPSTETPIKSTPPSEDFGLSGLPALLQNALKRQVGSTNQERRNSPSPKSESEEAQNARKIQDILQQIAAQQNGERPPKIRLISLFIV